jgi:hypothetical protein
LKSAIHVAVRQKKFANTTKVEYEFPEKSVIFRAGRVLDNFLLVTQDYSHKHGFRLTKKRGSLTSLFF